MKNILILTSIGYFLTLNTFASYEMPCERVAKFDKHMTRTLYPVRCENKEAVCYLYSTGHDSGGASMVCKFK